VSDNEQSGFHNQRTSQKRGESEKCISPWFHCPLSGGRRPTLYFTVFWAMGRRPTPSEWFLKGQHLISPFTQWAACSLHLLLSDSYNTYTKVKVVSPCEVWLIPPPSIYTHMCTLYTYTIICMPRFGPSRFFEPSRYLISTPGLTTEYRVILGHINHVFDPARVFLSTHWWSQHPACQRCFYIPLRNCHPSQQVSTPHVETLTL